MNKFAAMRTFASVAELGSFTAASKKLGMSVSVVTRMVAQLEDELGTRLINRTTRKLSLTDYGEEFFERSTRILAEVDEAEAAMRKASGVAKGMVRIVVPFLFGRGTLVPALPRFFAEHPEIMLQVNFSDRPIDLIEAGFDLGVRTGNLSDSRFVQRQLTAGPQITVASPDYLRRHGAPETPDDLHHHNCLMGRFGPDWVFRTPQGGRRRIRVRGNAVVFNGDALKECAIKGLGITHSSWWAVRKELVSGELVPVLEDYMVEGPPVSVIYPASRHLPAKVRVLIDFLVAIVKEEDVQARERVRSRKIAAMV
jgi:DNA-binding transcriptional LysR family regulator